MPGAIKFAIRAESLLFICLILLDHDAANFETASNR
jgi:hypothetical protein